MKYLLLLPGLLMALSHVSANLGETEAQIEVRYGKAVWELSWTPNNPENAVLNRRYVLNGVQIDVSFKQGRSDSEEYRKVNGGAFTDDEIHKLLNNSVMAGNWKEEPAADGKTKQWKLGDGEAFASYSNPTLTIQTKASAARVKQAAASGIQSQIDL